MIAAPSPDSPDPSVTQLLVALYIGQVERALVMIRSGQVNSIPYMAFMLMVQKNAASLVQECLSFPQVQPYVAFNRYESLRWAATQGSVQVMESLLRVQGAREYLLTSHNELLRVAIENGHLLMVALLTELPEVLAQITAENNRIYRYAVEIARQGFHPQSALIANHLWQIEAVRNFIVLPPPVPMLVALNGDVDLGYDNGKRPFAATEEIIAKERKLNPK